MTKIKNASIMGALLLALGMFFSTPGYTWWGGGGWHGGWGGYHAGWGHPGWGAGRWYNGRWYNGGVIRVNPVVAPFGFRGYYRGGCFVPGHRNYYGVWIPAHYRC